MKKVVLVGGVFPVKGDADRDQHALDGQSPVNEVNFGVVSGVILGVRTGVIAGVIIGVVAGVIPGVIVNLGDNKGVKIGVIALKESNESVS